MHIFKYFFHLFAVEMNARRVFPFPYIKLTKVESNLLASPLCTDSTINNANETVKLDLEPKTDVDDTVDDLWENDTMLEPEVEDNIVAAEGEITARPSSVKHDNFSSSGTCADEKDQIICEEGENAVEPHTPTANVVK